MRSPKFWVIFATLCVALLLLSRASPNPETERLTAAESERADMEGERMRDEIWEEAGLKNPGDEPALDSSNYVGVHVFPSNAGGAYYGVALEWIPGEDIDCPCGSAVTADGTVRVFETSDGRWGIETAVSEDKSESPKLSREYRIVCPAGRDPPTRKRQVHMPFVLLMRATRSEPRFFLWQGLLGPKIAEIATPLDIVWCVGESDCP